MSAPERVANGRRLDRLRTGVASQLRVPLVRNAYSLVTSTLTNAALGFVFWIAAARVFSVDVVGRDAALVSAMVFVSSLAQLNLGAGFNRFVPTAGSATRRLVRAGYLTSIVVALVISVVFVLGVNVWTPKLAILVSNPIPAAWFVLATVVWTIFTLEDGVLIGLGQGPVVLVENASFGVLKLIALVIVATQIQRFGVFLSWTLPLFLVVIPVNLFLFRRAIPRRSTAEPAEHLDVKTVSRFVGPDFAANLVRTATTTLMPIIVLAFIGTAASAYAYIAWSIGSTLYLLVNNVGASLITEIARAPERVVDYTRRALSHCFAIIVPLALITVVGAHLVLSFFGEKYPPHATVLLQFLALSSIPSVVVSTYVNVARAQRRMKVVFATTSLSSGAVLILSVIFLKTIGLNGVGLAWLVGQTGTAAIILLGDFRYVWRPKRDSAAPVTS